MFERFRKFLSDVAEGGKHPAHFDHNDYRLAAPALLVHTAEIDGNMAEAERRKLHDLLQRRFELSEADTQALISDATEAEHEAIDLYHFTTVINRSLKENDRLRIVQMMWEIIYADGRVSEFESNLIWRAADLLGISSRDRIELGRRVAGEQGEPPR
jgi:uncharacterized tellurite resistance protein B-like protein